MSSAALLRHYTGRMAGPARWYLAVLVMFSLGLLAAHFSVQEHVQKKLRLVVHDWLQESGGVVQHVRYRLLRGALTLEQVHWVDPSDPGMMLDVPQVFIRTSSRAMTSRHPSFSLLRFEGPQFSVRREAVLAWLRGDSASSLFSLSGLLSHARAVVVSDMRLRVVSDGADSSSRYMLLRQARGRFGPDGMLFSGLLGVGRILLDGHVDSSGQISGRIALRGISLDSLSVLSGHAASAAGPLTSGDLLLRGDWNKRDVDMRGTLRLSDDTGTGSLDVRGGWTATGAAMHVQCGNVPLAALPLAWPDFAGRQLAAGRLSGGMSLERNWQEAGWRIGMDGGLTGVRLVAADRPLWQIGSLSLKGAKLIPESGRFSAGEMQLADADISLNAFDAPDDGKAVPMPEIAALSLQHIRPQLHFADGSVLVLPELQGTGRLGRLGSVSLTTVRADADLADGAPGEVWKIKAQGDSFADWKAQLKAGHVPVVRLRPLLPDISLPGEKGVPEYSGYADFTLQMAQDTDALHVNGNAALHDVRMIQGGDQLSAARIDVDIADAGSDGARRLSRVALQNWQYQMALRPLPRLTQPAQAAVVAQSVDIASPDVEPAGVSGEAPDAPVVTVAPPGEDGQDSPGEESAAPSATSPALNWEVAEITAENGRISLGQPDALIAGQLLLRVHHLANGGLSPYSLSGELGDGDLLSQGEVQLQPGFLMASKTSVQNAVPFVFNDWMQLSGMPRFVRGRLNAVLHVAPDGPPSGRAYAGKLTIGLYQGAMEPGAFTEDPMVQRAGYSAKGLFERLNSRRRLRLAIPFKGSWEHSSLTERLGEAGLDELKQAAAKAPVTETQSEPPVVKLTRLRLQGKRGFSHNERLRLRNMAKALMANKSLIVELTPQLGTASLDAEMVGRVVYSQRLVERFLRHMGVAAKRIFPVWPQQKHRHGDAPGLLLRARSS